MKSIKIAIAIIQNDNGEVLIAERPQNKDFAEFWEFPGGKVESGESDEQALIREVYEELGIQIRPSRKLISLSHQYPNKYLSFEVWLCAHMMGKPEAREGQGFVRWLAVDAIVADKFPPANKAMINALKLPDCYFITESVNSVEAMIQQLKMAFSSRAKLIQIRQKSKIDNFEQVFNWLKVNKPSDIEIYLNSDSLAFLNAIPEAIDGIHLTTNDLMAEKAFTGLKLAASCHNESEIAVANSLEIEFITLSPVLVDKGAPKLGWQGFESLLKVANMPVYALGGITHRELEIAIGLSAQGIAGISFWQDA